MVSLEKVLTAPSRKPQWTGRSGTVDQSDEVQLRKLLEDHNRWTGSKRARELLDNWEPRAKFVKVFPNEYKRALGEIHAKKSAASVESSKSAQKRLSVAAKQGWHSSAQRKRIMGKVTGFMEFERIEEGYKPVAERLKHYKEFVVGLDDAQAKVRRRAAWTAAPRSATTAARSTTSFRTSTIWSTAATGSNAIDTCCTAPTTSPSSPVASAPRPARPPAR
jgi:hypothetical protein